MNASPSKRPAQEDVKSESTLADRAPAPIARLEIHETVARILDPFPRGKLLDVPAGEGALSARLSKAGFQVRACDLYPEIFRLPEIEVRRGDLSGVLPYNDAEFQYITCLEGLEHIENPHQAIREFARLLSPGGQLVISVPNILNIEERVKWLLNGYTSHFKPISEEHLRMRHEQWGEKEEVVLHINPIAYTELRYILEKYGFTLAGAYRDKPKPNIWLYWPLVAVIRLFARLTPERKRRERWTNGVGLRRRSSRRKHSDFARGEDLSRTGFSLSQSTWGTT